MRGWLVGRKFWRDGGGGNRWWVGRWGRRGGWWCGGWWCRGGGIKLPKLVLRASITTISSELFAAKKASISSSDATPGFRGLSVPEANPMVTLTTGLLFWSHRRPKVG